MIRIDNLKINPYPEKYPVLCAWCKSEGRRTVTGWTSVPNSHGICPDCATALRRDLEEVVPCK